MSYQSKDASLSARDLEVQTCVAQANLIVGSSDLPSNITIDNSVINSTVITLSVNETVRKCFAFKVTNRISGAVIATVGGPYTNIPQKIYVTVNGSGLNDVVIQVYYSVA